MRLNHLVILVTLGIALAGCPGANKVPCKDNASCDLAPGGICEANSLTGNKWCTYPDSACPSGMRWSDQDVGDGVSGTCVSSAIDAGVDAHGDGGNIDGGNSDGSVDASTTCPVTAPVQNGQAAELELGQPGFTSGTTNNPFLSGSSFSTTVGLVADSTRLWVSDSGNARVLQWNTFPAVNGQAASLAIGQADLITATSGDAQDRLGSGGGNVARAGSKLVISDSTNNRVLIWNSTPTANGQPADLVIGQTSFTTKVSGNGASSLSGPRGVWTDGTKLIVADRFNNRVLIWNTFPTANGTAANVVLGAPDFGMSPSTMPPTASSFFNPDGVAYDGQRLYVADEANNRVLVWNEIPASNNAPADQVLGQSGFDGASNNGGAPYPQVNNIGMKGPTSLLVDSCGSLYVCDGLNGRVMIYTHAPSGNGPAADAVLGKPDFSTQPSASVSPSAAWMGGCSGLAVAGASLYVGDAANNRVLRFSLSR